MKPVNVIYITILFLAMSLGAFCQTKRIAHKSHSGKAATFSRYSESNFGLPPLHLDSVRKTTDSKFIRYRSYGYQGSCAMIDTLTTHLHFGNQAISMDSLKVLYPETKFIGFEPAKSSRDQKTKTGTKKRASPHR